ncbi:hypothetical protein P8H26_12755 [Pseudochrobactrum sp. sp1633]|uniref:hypothetical protein n=1 Tax=Pseudochrobactrum sp. sp1633 TaxID=3036706 RepID=UPI0025A614B1|nr:hypothetical protein [Pseudochrobactrum sp. sp1633]MDM8346261.1 hypothetical protein [Pseudochrobactrum sp. sp1633]
MHTHRNLADSLSASQIGSIGEAMGFVKDKHSEADEISCLIEDARFLSEKVVGIIAAIVGGAPSAGCSKDQNVMASGVLNQLADRSRHVRSDIKCAGEELDRLARAFGV